jgi:hypothetical protein
MKIHGKTWSTVQASNLQKEDCSVRIVYRIWEESNYSCMGDVDICYRGFSKHPNQPAHTAVCTHLSVHSVYCV